MRKEEWNKLLEVVDGKNFSPLPMGFIIDSPWLPGWNGISTLDYYTSDKKWFQSNINAINSFPDVIFLPGFWSEYGMCTEPSAFGSKMVWDENNLPHADKIIISTEQIEEITKPDVQKDGLLPFVLKRLSHYDEKLQESGHSIKFAISRGPLNIASFLMGSTEFLLAIAMEPDRIHKLLSVISEFIIDWLSYQKRMFPSIEGIFMLDDIVGFLGDEDNRTFVVPYLKSIYENFDVPIKFFHNDAEGKICAPYLSEIGVNLFNFSFNHSLVEMKELTKNRVTLLGNIPPRDVLALGSEDNIKNAVYSSLNGIIDNSRIIMSCGGGMAPDVSTINLKAFISAVNSI